LLRAAPCAGDAELAGRFLAEVADPLRYPQCFTEEQADEIRRLKRRMEIERVARRQRDRDLKFGPGGLTDVEWVAQLLTLRHARELPELRVTGTIAALQAAVRAGLLPAADAEVLVRAWCMAAAARNAIMHVTGRASDVLPPAGRALDGVARLLGYPPGGLDGGATFATERSRLAGRARVITERVLYGKEQP
jgi:glutamate-ammonia-ligase adenylyltransferase